jgi:hypothetical protein
MHRDGANVGTKASPRKLPKNHNANLRTIQVSSRTNRVMKVVQCAQTYFFATYSVGVALWRPGTPHSDHSTHRLPAWIEKKHPASNSSRFCLEFNGQVKMDRKSGVVFRAHLLTPSYELDNGPTTYWTFLLI